MRRDNLFWGGILLILGLLFLLQAMGLITDVLGWFWPIFLMLLGVWVLFGKFLPGSFGGRGESFSVDLQGESKMVVSFDHGAGSVKFSGGAASGLAMTGSKGIGLEIKSHSDGNVLTVDLDAGPTFLPFLGPEAGVWDIQLTEDVPISLKADAGASSLDFDLTNVKLTYLGVDTGASSLKVKLPANAGHSLVDVESGAATIDITVPDGVGCRIRIEQGMSTINIDNSRFPHLDGGIYQSSDYDSAANKVEISLEGGANTVTIH